MAADRIQDCSCKSEQAAGLFLSPSAKDRNVCFEWGHAALD